MGKLGKLVITWEEDPYHTKALGEIDLEPLRCSDQHEREIQLNFAAAEIWDKLRSLLPKPEEAEALPQPARPPRNVIIECAAGHNRTIKVGQTIGLPLDYAQTEIPDKWWAVDWLWDVKSIERNTPALSDLSGCGDVVDSFYLNLHAE